MVSENGNESPRFERSINVGNFIFFNINPYIVKFLSLKGLINRKLMRLKKRFLHHSWPKSQSDKDHQMPNFDKVWFWTGLMYTSFNCKTVFFYPTIYNKDSKWAYNKKFKLYPKWLSKFEWYFVLVCKIK